MHSQNVNSFCVETKGVCFFCFHENPFSSVSPEDNGKDLNAAASSNISLKRLSRYLNVDFGKVFKIDIPLMYGNLRTSDVVVPLCGECAIVIRKFSKLHDELELVKMHVQSCVHTIREKMLKADREQDLTANYQKRWTMSDPVDAIQAGIVDNLRKETKEKCLSKFSKILPRVKLERLRMRKTRNLETDQTTRSLSIKRTHEIMTNEGTAGPVTSKNYGGTLGEVGGKHLPVKETLHVIQGKRVTEPVVLSGEKNLSRNFALQGNNLKSSGTLNPQFTAARENVHAMYGNTFISSTKQGATLTEPSAFPNQPKPFLRYVPISSAPLTSPSPLHSSSTISDDFTRNKYQKVGKNIEKPVRKPSPLDGPSYDCVHCEDVFDCKSTLRTHVVRSHCEQFFTTLKDKSLSPQEFKSIVYRLFKDVVQSPTEDATDKNSLFSKSTYNCPYCQVVHESDGDVYAHVFRFHYSELTSKLLALQKETLQAQCEKNVSTGWNANHDKTADPQSATSSKNQYCISPFLCVCGMRYASKRTLDFHRNYNCKFKNTSNTPSTSDYPNVPMSLSNDVQTPTTSAQATRTTSVLPAAKKFYCSHCSKTFPFHYDLRVHMLTSHQIEEFSKYVTTGVTNEQVHNELQRLVNTYRKLPGNNDAGGCLFCPEVFSQVIDLQNHILVGHFDVVVFKLRAVIPQHQQSMTHDNHDNDNNVIHNGPININVPALRKSIIPESEDNILSMKEDIADFDSNTESSVEFIMPPDPLSFDFMELDTNAVLCQEEQLKMEWLFSFIDDGSEVQSQEPNQQQNAEDDKGFILGANDSELILP